MTKYFLTLLLCGLTFTAMAQKPITRELTRFTNSQDIDPKRYEDIQGNPMLFKDWQKGKIIDNKDTVYNNVTINYNGFEEEFEVKRNNSAFIALNNKYYKTIIIESDQGIDGTLHFEKVADKRFKDKFLRVIHKGEKITIYKYFEARKGEVTVQDVGKTRTFENFSKVSTYYKLEGDRLKIIKVKKKSLVAELGEKKALDSYIKKNKLKTTNDLDLQKLLAHFETL